MTNDAKAAVREFDTRHETEGPKLLANGVFIYPDGAYRENSPLGIMDDGNSRPSAYTNPKRDKQQRIVKYWRLRAEQATAKFKYVKRWYTKTGTGLELYSGSEYLADLPEDDSHASRLKHLMAIRAHARHCIKRLAEEQEKLDEMDPNRTLSEEGAVAIEDDKSLDELRALEL